MMFFNTQLATYIPHGGLLQITSSVLKVHQYPVLVVRLI